MQQRRRGQWQTNRQVQPKRTPDAPRRPSQRQSQRHHSRCRTGPRQQAESDPARGCRRLCHKAVDRSHLPSQHPNRAEGATENPTPGRQCAPPPGAAQREGWRGRETSAHGGAQAAMQAPGNEQRPEPQRQPGQSRCCGRGRGRPQVMTVKRVGVDRDLRTDRRQEIGHGKIGQDQDQGQRAPGERGGQGLPHLVFPGRGASAQEQRCLLTFAAHQGQRPGAQHRHQRREGNRINQDDSRGAFESERAIPGQHMDQGWQEERQWQEQQQPASTGQIGAGQ